MDSAELMSAVTEMVSEGGLEFDRAENGSIFIKGSKPDTSAFVSLSTFDGSDGLVFVGFLSPVLQEFAPDENLRAKVLATVNQLNLESKFGRWVLVDHDDGSSSIFLQHELLGNTLDKAELFNAIARIVGTADFYDDQLHAAIGQGTPGLGTF